MLKVKNKEKLGEFEVGFVFDGMVNKAAIVLKDEFPERNGDANNTWSVRIDDDAVYAVQVGRIEIHQLQHPMGKTASMPYVKASAPGTDFTVQLTQLD